ncbi:helix-turn-helix domain-containing protein [Caproiciproducens sp. MSJ-32]|uniref:helix-turn-helix domain-containing protein n=1 Tax=Caproiciproducens sp. MSJ-32 TaxID=2841527 RepID=UPI001C0F5190|nr:helix-turn-helix transcriptional regulator [Caproiciproducens sp. MSJ-32]MBU5454449.1 helix-turn-helix domain-containing protein [Caproiciproducens sp. MSJ-32]
MNFSEKLQILRKEKRLSQEGLAEKLNVSRQAVSKWESGQSFPELDKIIILSDIFSVTVDELVKDNIELKRNIEDKKTEEKKNDSQEDKEYQRKEDTINNTYEEGHEKEKFYKKIINMFRLDSKEDNNFVEAEEEDEEDVDGDKGAISELMFIGPTIGMIIYFITDNSSYIIIGPLLGFVLDSIFQLYLRTKRKG